MRLLGGRPPRVDKLARKGDVERLVQALGYEDPISDRDGRVVDLGAGVREAAIEALTQLDGPVAHDGLVRALDDPEERVRVAAIRALGARAEAASAEPLAAIATGRSRPEHVDAREEATEALVTLRHPGIPARVAAEFLVRPEELDDSDAAVFQRIAEGAGPPKVHATIDELAIHLREASAPARARTLLVWLAPDSVDTLIELLGDERARHDAVLALGEAHDSRAVEPLCSILRGKHEPAVRSAAAWALGEIRDPAAVETLLVATGDSDYDVRTAAGASFDSLGNAAIAMAMSALVRPALENGSGPAPARKPLAPSPEPALPQRQTQTRTQSQPQPHETFSTRAAPVLRRLLGRDEER